jgi:hypothetical protein
MAISKLEAARQQLDCAIRLLDSEDLPAHTLAYAAYCLLRDLIGPGPTMQVLRTLEKQVGLRVVPEFLKHAEDDPNALLKEHSPKTAHLTIALAIRLWKEHGQEVSEAMRDFCKRPDPYQTGYRHGAALEVVQHHPLQELGNIVTQASTVSGAPTIPGPPRRSPTR